jgi:DNA-binding NarL/FixJ family response regulator
VLGRSGFDRRKNAMTPLPISRLLVGKRIVIVEDDGVILLQFRKVLTRAGLLVVGQAMSGEKGLALISQEKPDLAVIDVTLQGMDGIEVTRRVMQECPTCVVVVSDHPNQQHQAKQAGACGFVIKPVSAEILIPALDSSYEAYGRK